MERSSQLYRALAAVPPWILYFLSKSSAEGTKFFTTGWLASVCAVYLACKAHKAVKLPTKWKLSLAKLFQNTVINKLTVDSQLNPTIYLIIQCNFVSSILEFHHEKLFCSTLHRKTQLPLNSNEN